MTYLICGYGIPSDIHTDRNYIGYLDLVFNHIYEEAKGQEAVIVLCGGPTDCEPPYTRTEAGEMARYLKALMDRDLLLEATNTWRMILEDQSLSTLENLVFAKRLIDDLRVQDRLTIFGAKNGAERRQITADAVFGVERCRVVSIDFDISKNRYLDPELLEKKEARALEESLWTLQDPDRLLKHHQNFEKKFAFLRRRQSEGVSHVDAIEEWYKHAEEILDEAIVS